jgi:hypothetical protein
MGTVNTRYEAREWMKDNRESYRDECDEINCTKLAEDCADNFNLYKDRVDWEIPEWVFGLAVEVAEHETAQNMLRDTDHGDECPLCQCGTVEHVGNMIKCRGECAAECTIE